MHKSDRNGRGDSIEGKKRKRRREANERRTGDIVDFVWKGKGKAPRIEETKKEGKAQSEVGERERGSREINRKERDTERGER